MAYQKQSFTDNETLWAYQMELIENGILEAEKKADEALKKAGSCECTTTPAITAITVTESANGSVTITESLEDGTTNTIAITADANGNPSSVGGIPIEWVVSA